MSYIDNILITNIVNGSKGVIPENKKYLYLDDQNCKYTKPDIGIQ
jgi:hypothetical protein